LPISLFKAGPSDYVVKYVAGKKMAEGIGRVFLVGPRTTVARIPASTVPIPLNFDELTLDMQSVRIQGEIHVKLNSARVFGRYDFSIDPASGFYRADDPLRKVQNAVCATLQGLVRAEIEKRTLKDALTGAGAVEAAIRAEAESKNQLFDNLGITVETIFISAISPSNSKLKEALEAEARERLLTNADKAIADRREKAAQNERKLSEYEDETVLSRERKRKELVDAHAENQLKEAEGEAAALKERLSPLTALEPATIFALGFRDIMANGNIGNLSFTPELLNLLSGINGIQKGITHDK
jgi:hypothetical protein